MKGFYTNTHNEEIFNQAIDLIEREFSHLTFDPITHNLYDHFDDFDLPLTDKKNIWNKNTSFIVHSVIPNEGNSIGLLLVFERGGIGSTIYTKSVLYYKVPKIHSNFYLHHNKSWQFISENEKLEQNLNQNSTLLELINSYIKPSKELYGVEIDNSIAIFTTKWINNSYLFLTNLPYLNDDEVSLFPDAEVDIVNAVYSEIIHL